MNAMRTFFALFAALVIASQNQCAFCAEESKVERLDRLLGVYMKQGEKMPATYEAVKAHKSALRGILELAEDEQMAGVVAERLCECLAEGRTFRASDYYILWLAGKFLAQHARVERIVLARVVDKLESVAGAPIPHDLRHEFVGLGAEFISSHVDYDGDIVGDDGRLGSEWKAFRVWWDNNRHLLKYDETSRRWKGR